MCNIKYTEKEMAEAISDLVLELENYEISLHQMQKILNPPRYCKIPEIQNVSHPSILNILKERHPVIDEICEFGPDGPAGIGLGNYGSHSV